MNARIADKRTMHFYITFLAVRIVYAARSRKASYKTYASIPSELSLNSKWSVTTFGASCV